MPFFAFQGIVFSYLVSRPSPIKIYNNSQGWVLQFIGFVNTNIPDSSSVEKVLFNAKIAICKSIKKSSDQITDISSCQSQWMLPKTSQNIAEFIVDYHFTPNTIISSPGRLPIRCNRSLWRWWIMGRFWWIVGWVWWIMGTIVEWIVVIQGVPFFVGNYLYLVMS